MSTSMNQQAAPVQKKSRTATGRDLRQPQDPKYVTLKLYEGSKRFDFTQCAPLDRDTASNNHLRIHYPEEFVPQLSKCTLYSRQHFDAYPPNAPLSSNHHRLTPSKSNLRRTEAHSLLTQSAGLPKVNATHTIPSSSAVSGRKRKRDADPSEPTSEDEGGRPRPAPPTDPEAQTHYENVLPFTSEAIKAGKPSRVSFANDPIEALTELASQRAIGNLASPGKPVHSESPVEKAAKRYNSHCRWKMESDPAMLQLKNEAKDLVGKLVDCSESAFQQELVGVFIDIMEQAYLHCPTYKRAQKETFERLNASNEVFARMSYLRSEYELLAVASQPQAPQPQDDEQPLADSSSPAPSTDNHPSSARAGSSAMPSHASTPRTGCEHVPSKPVEASILQSDAVWKYSSSNPVERENGEDHLPDSPLVDEYDTHPSSGGIEDVDEPLELEAPKDSTLAAIPYPLSSPVTRPKDGTGKNAYSSRLAQRTTPRDGQYGKPYPPPKEDQRHKIAVSRGAHTRRNQQKQASDHGIDGATDGGNSSPILSRLRSRRK